MHVFIHNHPNAGARFYDLLLFLFIQVWRDLSRDSIFVQAFSLLSGAKVDLPINSEVTQPSLYLFLIVNC